MLNLVNRDITYTHRKSDFTQDVYVEGCWIASANCNHAGEEVADEVQYRGYLDVVRCSICGGGDSDCPDCDPSGGRGKVVATYQPLAQTRQSQAIEARLTVCGYCAGIHHIQACPVLRGALLADTWKGADLGRGLCQLRWRNHAGFVQLLSNATTARLAEYAESYIAFLASRSSTNLTTREVLSGWLADMGNDRGPAAMAMSVAA